VSQHDAEFAQFRLALVIFATGRDHTAANGTKRKCLSVPGSFRDKHGKEQILQRLKHGELEWLLLRHFEAKYYFCPCERRIQVLCVRTWAAFVLPVTHAEKTHYMQTSRALAIAEFTRPGIKLK